MNEPTKPRFWGKVGLLFLAGFAGVLSALPLIPQLMGLTGSEPPVPMLLIQVVSTLQTSVLLFVMVFLGARLAPGLGLGTPLVDAWLDGAVVKADAHRVLLSALVGGLVGGLLMLLLLRLSAPALPAEFLQSAESFRPPFLTRLLYGGITEELLIRWGLMSALAWGFLRLITGSLASTGSGGEKKPARPAFPFLAAIACSAILFGVGHLPLAMLLSPALTIPLILYVIAANALFGLIAGYLFWKRGLESAIVAHMVAHVVVALAGG